jgi:signal transduction histidine kinase
MLLVAAAVPTACVLWFMGQAMRNERLATRQKLLEAYRAPLEQARTRLERYWQDELGAGAPACDPRENEPGRIFAAYLARGCCDSVVLCDPAGKIRYPDTPDVAGQVAEAIGPEWEAAEALEFRADDPAGAAGLYLEAARAAKDPAVGGRARIACARCLARAGQKAAAVDLLTKIFEDPALRQARDAQGRSVALDAGLLLLDLLDSGDPRDGQIATCLGAYATDYEHSPLPAGQRRHVMERLAGTLGSGAFPTLPAERLAAEYVDAQGPRPAPGRLTRAPIADFWQLASADGTGIALYREGRLVSGMSPALNSEPISGATIRLLKPDERGPEPFLAVPAAEAMPGWRLVLSLDGPAPFTDIARRRAALYLWTGLAVALLTVSLTLLVGRYVGRQVRLTRLKNDLIATVSHELKTPLAGIRALVDTLLDNGAQDPKQTHEYLELIARENLRLSRLIDNFLAFSRMERNKHAFEFADVSPEAIVKAAAEAAGERFCSPGCHLEVKVEPGLPAVVADRDALVTVLLNLLDNAFKYTGEDKRVGLRAYSTGGGVCFEVRDNGIGLSRRAARRVFDRFYQADRSLSRKAGGCGLGLSIVRFIVEAHGGTVAVGSQPGKGSVFTVSLPAQPDRVNRK